MAKKQKSVVRIFGITIRLVSRAAGKDSRCYGVQVRVTGGKRLGNAVRKFGRALRSRFLTKGAVLAIAAALVGIAA
ncbi:hypothetical protein J8F10_31940 [Gemmata sp. G18]|uniref:Uncharacterized protein n=1 Tax=Gemmata palustris TaxID=2822762 RepID=A0ABS5C1L7_9BACT|nr:hypothetical protein [Gemmata palustris]MBP3959882.1 hypothetical protein [Gemmata palustris]